MWINVDEDLLRRLLEEKDSRELKAYLRDTLARYTQTLLEKEYVKAAKTLVEEGELEVDDSAVVSLGEYGGGAYVMAWVWVRNEEAGVEEEEEG